MPQPPLASASPIQTPPGGAIDLRRTIGFWGATAVMIGVIIGSGIFKTPADIAKHLDSPLLILGLWGLGGLLCLAGALTYAELASMYPSSGGVYVFIREGYGPCAAFVFGWAYLLLMKPFGAAGIALVCAEHITILLDIPGTPEQMRLWNQSITTAVLLSLTLINWRGVKLSTGVSVFLTAIKFSALVAIVLLVVTLGQIHGNALAPAGSPSKASAVAGAVTIMSLILWTYDGWSDLGAIAGEVKNPQRLLPRVFIAGTAAIIVTYLLVNLAYFAVVPLDQMRAMSEADPKFSVAAETMRRLIGGAGATAIAIVIVLSALGSSHGSVMTGARVSYAQARDGLLFRFIGHVHPRFITPDWSLFTQVFLAIVAVWFLGSFQKLADSFVFTAWIFYAMAAATIFIDRARRPAAERPFRCPGYPLVPALFILAAIGMTVLSLMEATWLKLGWLAVLVAGVPVYYVWKRLVETRKSGP